MAQHGFSKEQVKEIMAQAQNFWDRASATHSTFYTNASDRLRIAHGLLPTDLEDEYRGHPDMSSLAPPDIHVNIEAIRAAINNIVFMEKPYAKVTLFGQPQMVNETTEKAESLLQHMNDLADDETQFDPVIYQALACGMGCIFTPWITKRVRQPLRTPDGKFLTDKDGQIVWDIEVVARYGGSVGIDIRRMRIDPSIDRIEDRKLVGHHYIGSLFNLLSLKKDSKHFYDFDEADLRKSSFPREKYYEYVPGESDKIDKARDNHDFGDKIIEVKTIRGLFRIKDVDSFVFKDLIVDIANDTVPLGIKVNDLPIPGYEMYSFPTVDNELGRLFPMGVVEPAEDTWISLFMLMNNVHDRNTRETFDVYLGDKLACQGLPAHLEHENGKIFMVDTVAAGLPSIQAALQPMVRQPLTNQSFQLIGQMQNMVQQIMKLNDYMQSVDPGRKETATAVSALMQGGQSLLMHMIRKLTQSGFKPAWQKKLILWNHFMGDQNYRLYNQNKKWIDINPGELNSYWQIDVDTNAAKDRPDLIRRVVESFTMLYALPETNKYELVKTFHTMLNLPNKDKLITPNEVLQAAIDKENMALLAGLPVFVHPGEHHDAHIEGHMPILEYPGLDPKRLGNVEDHINLHLAEKEKINMGQLANTKDVGVGQNVSPAIPSQTHSTGSSSGLARENR